MGSGSRTREQKVVKEPGGRGSRIGYSENKAERNECIFTLAFNFQVSKNAYQTISVGDQVRLAPNFNSTGIDVFINNKLIGPFQGNKLQILLRCMEQGFTYEGKVIGKSANFELTLEVNGYE